MFLQSILQQRLNSLNVIRSHYSFFIGGRIAFKDWRITAVIAIAQSEENREHKEPQNKLSD